MANQPNRWWTRPAGQDRIELGFQEYSASMELLRDHMPGDAAPRAESAQQNFHSALEAGLTGNRRALACLGLGLLRSQVKDNSGAMIAFQEMASTPDVDIATQVRVGQSLYRSVGIYNELRQLDRSDFLLGVADRLSKQLPPPVKSQWLKARKFQLGTVLAD